MAELPKVKVADPRARDILFDALKQKARGQTALVKVTRADAVALTGMPNEQAEPALKSLVATYRSHMAVTEEGELVYEFDPSLERRDKVPLGERVKAAGQVAWKGFQFLFKIWIVVTLVAYVVAFVAMMIAMMVSRQSSDDRDRRGGGGFPMLWFWLMPDLAPPGYHDDAYMRRMRQQQRNLPKKRFYQSVFDFVFGPKSAPLDPRETDKRLLAFLRDHKGRVTASELSALTGLSLASAEEELTRLMVEYDGEVEVAADGTLLYVFEDVLPSASAAGTHWTWAWDKADPVPAMTGNTSGANTAIAAFAGFNLIASTTVGPAFLARYGLTQYPWTSFFVTLFPLIFSAIFFAVPAARWVVRQRQLKKRERRQLRRELLREIWARPGELRDPEELAGRAAQRTAMPLEAAKQMLDTLVRDLDGDVTTDEEGRMRYVFPRLVEERAAVEGARRAAPDKQLGQVVFSSEDEEPARG